MKGKKVVQMQAEGAVATGTVQRKRKVDDMKGRKPEFAGCTLCNVLRVPQVDDAGKQVVSAKGSLLMDTLCFSQDARLSIVKKVVGKPEEWVVSVDGKQMSIADARKVAIGTASLKDTTTGLVYLVRDNEGMDAIPMDTKREIVKRSKRRNGIKITETVCKLLKRLASIQGVADCFNDKEKAELYNTPAKLLNEFHDNLYKVQRPKGEVAKFLSLSN